MEEVLKPCPFCGHTDVYKYISLYHVFVECQNCGASVKNNGATVLYKGDPPKELVGVETYEPNALEFKRDDGPNVPATELGYKGVSLYVALEAYGVIESWNTRKGEQ